MDVITGLGVAALASLWLLKDIVQTRARNRKWRKAAAAVGLAGVGKGGVLRIPTRLAGHAGGLLVEFAHYQHDGIGAVSGTQITVAGLGHGASGLSLRRENVGTAVERAVGGREIAIGDWAFDDELHVQGNAPLARALLDAETRWAVRSLFQGRLPREGRADGEVRFRLAQDALQAEVADPGYWSTAEGLAEVLGAMLDLARRLVAPTDIPGRIAENLRSEPEASVRLPCLLTLIREFPKSPATRAALLAAREDPDAEVRLEVGKALGTEGREVVLGVAAGEGVKDATSARAVSWLASPPGKELSVEETQPILSQALRARRTATAAACLGVLGARGGAEAIHTLAKVLAVEKGELAGGAAEALGRTSDPKAEEPLLQALAEESHPARIAAARALGRVGTAAAVAPLLAAESDGGELRRAARQAIAEIQSRLAETAGAAPGQLSIAGAEAGQVSLVEEDTAGQLALAEPANVRRNVPEECTPLRPQRTGVEEAIAEQGPSVSGPQARRPRTSA